MNLHNQPVKNDSRAKQKRSKKQSCLQSEVTRPRNKKNAAKTQSNDEWKENTGIERKKNW